jgi:coenzyme F420-reducing hydrogenase delta subunit
MSKKSTTSKTEKPSAIAFICNWCLPGNNDLIFETFQNLKPIRVMCSGRVTVGLILKAFERGAQGVAVLGCEDDSCHYITGNRLAHTHVEKTKNLLKMMGISEDCLEFIPLSRNGGEKVTRAIQDWNSRLAGLHKVTGQKRGKAEKK